MIVSYTNLFGITIQTYSKRVRLIEERDHLVQEIMDSSKFGPEARRVKELSNNPKIIRLNRRIKKIFE